MAYIELFGLGGSGKTTLAKKWAREKGYIARPLVKKSKTDFILCFPLIYFFKALKFTLKYKVRKPLKTSFDLSVNRYYYNKYKNTSQTFVNDHGFIQTLAPKTSIEQWEDERFIEELKLLIPKDADMYYVRKDWETTMNQFMKRNNLKRTKNQEKRFRKAYKLSEKRFSILKKAFGAKLA